MVYDINYVLISRNRNLTLKSLTMRPVTDVAILEGNTYTVSDAPKYFV